MRKQKVLFLCTQNSTRSQMAEGLLRHHAGDRFEAHSAGLDPIDEIHPCAVEAMREVGIDISGQSPKGLKEYMGKQTFNYLIIVCARAEERCPMTFPGVGTTFSWIFDDPRRDEDLPYDSMLERFHAVRDEIELRMRGWLEQPEAELGRLREERERERLEAEKRGTAPVGGKGCSRRACRTRTRNRGASRRPTRCTTARPPGGPRGWRSAWPRSPVCS
jgi:arsenate reductase